MLYRRRQLESPENSWEMYCSVSPLALQYLHNIHYAVSQLRSKLFSRCLDGNDANFTYLKERRRWGNVLAFGHGPRGTHFCKRLHANCVAADETRSKSRRLRPENRYEREREPVARGGGCREQGVVGYGGGHGAGGGDGRHAAQAHNAGVERVLHGDG